ncbi:hypothetical protein [Methylobacterium sp. J-092]|uniref:hypothetical protein n=1 Tax=Methylobacterium sp. J-092 TaxID=2836667 RepID=UPI001FBB7FD1|nr:hypothetical protein [Methylobacterium sp. J-092]MCJ2007056.1 hypothetical protein [Methylobacterium sp. J-092]
MEDAVGRIDVTLKKLLTGRAPAFQEQIGLPRQIDFLPGEVLEDTELRVDVLARRHGGDGPWFHAELQSTNKADMLLRMLRYRSGLTNRLAVEKRFAPTESVPLPDLDQVCVYVGQSPMKMANSVNDRGLHFGFRLIDARSLDPERQLSSVSVNDNVLGVLCRNGSTPDRIDRILAKVASLGLPERSDAFARLLVLSDLRGMRDRVLTRREEMGFSVDLSGVPMVEDAFLRERARTERETRAGMVINALEGRFGEDSVPAGVRDALEDLNVDALTRMIMRVPNAKSVEGVLGNHMPVSARTYG